MVLTLPYRCAYTPVSNEWNIIIVSSKSQTKTRSKSDSGPGDGLARLRPALLRLLPSTSRYELPQL